MQFTALIRINIPGTDASRRIAECMSGPLDSIIPLQSNNTILASSIWQLYLDAFDS